VGAIPSSPMRDGINQGNDYRCQSLSPTSEQLRGKISEADGYPFTAIVWIDSSVGRALG
jgi:hypothetical protein